MVMDEKGEMELEETLNKVAFAGVGAVIVACMAVATSYVYMNMQLATQAKNDARVLPGIIGGVNTTIALRQVLLDKMEAAHGPTASELVGRIMEEMTVTIIQSVLENLIQRMKEKRHPVKAMTRTASVLAPAQTVAATVAKSLLRSSELTTPALVKKASMARNRTRVVPSGGDVSSVRSSHRRSTEFPLPHTPLSTVVGTAMVLPNITLLTRREGLTPESLAFADDDGSESGDEASEEEEEVEASEEEDEEWTEAMELKWNQDRQEEIWEREKEDLKNFLF
jgi:hypothetical protein